MEKPIELKKYTNRRLYDADQKKFVTLGEVAEMIRGGRQIKVSDAKTMEDVTAFILTQIVLEQAKNHHALLPVPLLHLIIQYGDNALSGFFETYLQQIVQSYLNCKWSVDEQFQRWLDLGEDASKAAQQSLMKLNPLNALFDGFSGKTQPKKPKG
jgi:polyhydroxyalkanoate synthesis repressor PhaR